MRELRQNLSVYLRRVKRGERLEVTEHGQPVAVLAPLPKTTSNWDRLIAEGVLIPATAKLSDIPPPLGPNLGHAVSGEIIKDREDQRF